MPLALKLLIDENGRVYGVEPGDPSLIEVKPGDVEGAPVEAITLQDPADPSVPIAVKEVKLGPTLMAARCCLRPVNGVLRCIPC